MKCTAEGCTNDAVTVLAFRDQFGHVHVCSDDEAIDREWCEVTQSAQITDGVCPWPCSPPLYTAEPTRLGDR